VRKTNYFLVEKITFKYLAQIKMVNFMHAASVVSFAAAGYMVKTQLDTADYQGSGYTLFAAMGVVVDLNIWLPLLIAIPLFLLGQVLDSAKTSSVVVAPTKASAPIEEVDAIEEFEDEDEEVKEAVVVSTKKKAAPKKKASAKKKAAPKKRKARSKTPVKKKATPKKKAITKKVPAKKVSAKKAPAKKTAAPKTTAARSKTPVRKSSVRQSGRSRKTPKSYDPSVSTDTTFF
jgi:outer membrane biosynthesis protein TonB